MSASNAEYLTAEKLLAKDLRPFSRHWPNSNPRTSYHDWKLHVLGHRQN
jgi:hypothetical protein